MVDKLITDFISFDSIVDSLDEFHKTEAYSTKFFILFNSEQRKEIEELSEKNKEMSNQVVSKIKEFGIFMMFYIYK